MSNGFASALEISAKIIRDNLAEPASARRLIAERIHTSEQNSETGERENGYLLNMRQGFTSALDGLYAIAKRGER
jgi:hypothetical protein